MLVWFFAVIIEFLIKPFGNPTPDPPPPSRDLDLGLDVSLWFTALPKGRAGIAYKPS
jgi:hypothetical protein